VATHLVNTHEAKTRLSELIREAEQGVEVIVARHGRPVARIVPWEAEVPVRRTGRWAGRLRYDDADVVASDPDVVAAFDDSADSETV
jgi:prevent-host-death family protein